MANKFNKPAQWRTYNITQTWVSFDKYPRVMADVNGDGKKDIIGFGEIGTYVALSNGAKFLTPTLWISNYGTAATAGLWPSFNRDPRTAADVDGDGKADIVGFGDNGVYVSLSDGTKFLTPTIWIADYGYSTIGSWSSFDLVPRTVGDVNGDGKADIIGFAGGGVYVALSDGTKFLTASMWTANFGTAQGWGTFDYHPRAVADVDGDGKADIIGFANSGAVVAISTGASFLTPTYWIALYGANDPGNWSSFDKYPRIVADVNGDGMADIVGFAQAGTYASLSDGTKFLARNLWITNYGNSVAVGGWDSFNKYPRAIGDINGDGKADIVGFSSLGSMVSLSVTTSFSGSGVWIANFGTAQTLNNYNIQPKAFGDVNGDGKADLVEFKYDGTYVSLSDGVDFLPSTLWIAEYSISIGGWSNFDYNPRVVADVNGDGKADVIGFGTAGTIVSLSDGTKFLGGNLWIANYGINQGWTSFDTYPRMLADVNGDGMADIIGFANSGVSVALSDGTKFISSGYWIMAYCVAQTWTSFNINPRFVADVNGDGKADIIGIASDGVYVSLSNGTQFLNGGLWVASFAPAQTWHNFDGAPRVVADVNGDGKADIVGFSSVGTEVVFSDGTKFLGIPTPLMDFGLNKGWISYDTYPRFAADINGDGRADIIGINGEGIFVSLHSTQTISLSSSLSSTVSSSGTNTLSSSLTTTISSTGTNSLSSTETSSSSLSLTNSKSSTLSPTHSQTATSSLTLSVSETISKSQSQHTHSLSFTNSKSLTLTNSKTETSSLSSSHSWTASTSTSLHATSVSLPDTLTLSRTNDKIPTSSNTISQSGKFTATKYSSTIAPVGEVISENTHTALPIAVIETAKTVAAVASVGSVVTFSVSNVAQSARIATVSNLITCVEGEPLTSGPLSWYVSPTQMSAGFTRLKHVDGAVLGNWVLFGGLCATHSLVALKYGAAEVSFPSACVVYVQFLSSQTTQSSTVLIHLGESDEKVFGYTSLIIQGVSIIAVAVFLKTKFGATTEERASDYFINKISMFMCDKKPLNSIQQKWLPLDPSSKFVEHHGMLFKDYRIEWYGFIVAELFMSMGSGVLDGLSVEADSCSNLIYAATAMYGSFSVITIAMSPHRHPLDKAFFGAMTVLQFTAVSFGAIQKIEPSLQENSKLQITAEVITVILQCMSIARTIYDIGTYAQTLYKLMSPRFHSGYTFLQKKFFKGENEKNDSESSRDDIAKLLLPDDDDPAPRDGDINNDENFVADGKHGLLTGGMFAGAAAISPSALSADVQSLLDSLLDNNENPPAVADIINGVTINADENAPRNPASIYRRDRSDIKAAVEATGDEEYDEPPFPQPAGYTNQQQTLDDILNGPQPAGHQAAPATSQAEIDRLLAILEYAERAIPTAAPTTNQEEINRQMAEFAELGGILYSGPKSQPTGLTPEYEIL
jgi:hypothetical protein